MAMASAALRAREAAALTACARWAYTSALARAESRGMHRRRDLPEANPDFVCAIEVAGLDQVSVRRRPIATGGSAP